MSVFFSIVWHLPITDSTLSYIPCSVLFHISMLSYSIKPWLPPLWYLNQQNFKLSTNSSRICQNNSSMLLESSCSEVENQKDEVHLPRERFSFSEIWTVQPRSDSCPAEASGLGWTVRPRLDSPDRGKWKFSRGKWIESERFSTSDATTFKQHGFIFYAF